MSAAPKHLSRPAPPPLNARMRSHDLAAVPFAQLLVELSETRETGSLMIQARRPEDDQPLRAAIYFAHGEPLAVLAEGCAARGVRPVLVELCGLPAGHFEFVDGHDLVGERGARAAAPVDPCEVVLTHLRDPSARASLDRALSELRESRFRVHATADLTRYGLREDEQRVATALAQGAHDLMSARSRLGVPDLVLLPVLAALWLTRALEVIAEHSRPRSGTVRAERGPVAAPTSARHPQAFSATRSLAAQRAVSRPVSRPMMPPLARNPSPSMPPNLPPGMPPRTSTRPASELSSLPPVTDAKARNKLFKATWANIELLAQRQQYAEALEAALEALKSGESLPEHQALLAWIIYQHSGAGQDAHPKVLNLLERALRRDPLCEKALYYAAMVLKLTGRSEQAHAHFERLLLINPSHVEAVREVRLFRMRQRQQSSGIRRLFPGSR